ncbi:uncharacterized protein ATNIH1004_008151 [Aspergillus tanneri]|nr:uncharacterized protein ATNIH1004_008151 [Aspergillus tanneri]KAA8643955.1 hypothetical protein ATNIH1004_008151 [Aspergillus tanneri]
MSSGFSSHLKSCLSTVDTPEDIRIRQALPASASASEVVRESLQQKLDEINTRERPTFG